MVKNPYVAFQLWLSLEANATQDFNPSLLSIIRTLYALNRSDLFTFLLPNTLFGLIGVLSSPILTNPSPTSSPPSLASILTILPFILFYNILHLSIFSASNQRLSASEDALNKPYRPIPSGLITSPQMTTLLFFLIPCALGHAYLLSTPEETALLIALTWMYNDLNGNTGFIRRSLLNAIAYGLCNSGALRVALSLSSPTSSVSPLGHTWIWMISLIIFTTVHIQELKDQVGDAAIGRSTMPLYFGDQIARWTIAVPVAFWSVFAPVWMGVGWVGYVVPCFLGAVVATRVLWYREEKADKLSWEIWAGWVISFYALPLIRSCGW